MRGGLTKNEGCYHQLAKHRSGCKQLHNGDGGTAGPYYIPRKLLEGNWRVTEKKHIVSAAPSCTKCGALSSQEGEQSIDKRRRGKTECICEMVIKRTKQTDDILIEIGSKTDEKTTFCETVQRRIGTKAVISSLELIVDLWNKGFGLSRKYGRDGGNDKKGLPISERPQGGSYTCLSVDKNWPISLCLRSQWANFLIVAK